MLPRNKSAAREHAAAGVSSRPNQQGITLELFDFADVVGQRPASRKLVYLPLPMMR